jgi:hypothetical protein
MNLKYAILGAVMLVLLGVGCNPVEQSVAPTVATIPTIELSQVYSNDFYKFSVQFPETARYCLNDFCNNDVRDSAISYITIPLADSDNQVEVRVWKNNLGMSATEYAEKSLASNREHDKQCQYSDEKDVLLDGEKTFQFIATTCFEQRGYVNPSDEKTGQSIISLHDDWTRAGSGIVLDTPHQIIYLDHNGNLFRIKYPINNVEAQQIVQSFSLE